MICRDKIGNLHTSYEKMGDSYHLKAFFGVNVTCAMNEVLKFPGLFKMEDLSEYLDSVVVIPKKKSITYINHTSYLSPKYLAEEQEIKPRLLSISSTGDGILYFYFDQHFSIHDKKRYKVQVGVLDKSLLKALRAKEEMIKANKEFTKITKQEQIIEIVVQQALHIAELAESIQRKNNSAYTSLSGKNLITIDQLHNLSSGIKEEIKYIDNRMGIKSVTSSPSMIGVNNPQFQTLESNMMLENRSKYFSASNIIYFEKEFKKEVFFNFKQERESDLNVKKHPDFPITKIFDRSNIVYTLNNKIKTSEIKSLPSFDNSYSKKHLYDYQQTLKEKAEKYNISFVNKIDQQYITNTQNFIVENSTEPIYVLSGHNGNNVTAEIFNLLEQTNLQPNSTYLCKTEMVESENQYFILET